MEQQQKLNAQSTHGEVPTLVEPNRKEHTTVSQSPAPPNLISPGSESISPEALTLVELDQQQIDTIVRTVPGGAKNIQDIYPLSPLQEGLLFHRLLNERSDTYVLTTLFELESHAQVEVLADALQKVMSRHDVLRSAVLWKDLARPVQVVYLQVALPIEQITLDPSRDPIEQLQQRMIADRPRLELHRAPLMSLHIAADVRERRWFALLHVHHVICDHQSLRLLVAEALACVRGRERHLPAPIAYRNYVAQALALALAGKREAEDFFRGKLAEVNEPTAPFGLFDVHGDGSLIEEAQLTIESGLAQGIRVQARAAGVSSARLFHAAWGLVVALTSGRDDVVYGTVVLTARQRNPQAQRMLGMSVNTLPLRLRLQGVTAKELVEQTHEELVRLLNHDHTPLTLAQRCSGVVGTTPLFTTLLNYRHSAPDLEIDQASACGIRALARGEARTNYPIALTVDDVGDGFVLTAQADRRVGPYRVMGYLCAALQSLVQALEKVPQAPALALSVLPESERRQVIELFNATRAVYPHEKLIHEVFEAQVQREPDALALVYDGQSLTFAELNGKANQLARYLRDKGVGPDQLVALCVQRGLESIVGLLGTLKAGGAYVPLDPDYPTERLQHMLKDAAPRVVLTQQRMKAALAATQAEVVALDSDWPEIGDRENGNLGSSALDLRCDHLAYVIYTSGSTGQPKGVMIEHRNVLNLWRGLEQLYSQADRCERIALNASFSFDASVQQLVQLLSGRTIFIVPQQCRRDASMLLSFIHEHRVQAIDCTPSQLKSWVSAGLLEGGSYPLRVVLVGGEAIDADLWRSLAQSSKVSFFNVYGPTECTVDATAAHLNRDTTTPHIGSPMENRCVYILDGGNAPVPIGVTGEIYIGGAGVGRGYLNRPELTAGRFIRDPFSADPRARLYRTGDLGRWRPSGIIEYLGRNDHQVKIRGYRIELEEIEAQLARHPQLRQAVVIAREDVPGEKRLVAYVVLNADGPAAPGVEALRAHLKAALPEYMVPSAFVVLERLPLTPSGKLDRRGLPLPDLAAYVSRQYEAPRGEAEEVIAEIWQSLLRVERVGRHDNFFELGGHSLLAMQAIARIQSWLSIDVPIGALFESPTVKELSAHVDDLRSARMLERITDGGSEVAELVEAVTSMPDSAVQELLQKYVTEGRS